MMGLDAVRKRPGMYVGDTGDGTGLLNMVMEAVGNAFKQALKGHADRIDIVLHADGSCAVSDNGQGMPTVLDPRTRVPMPEAICTQLHAGRFFDRQAVDYPGRLHGVGIAVLNALSSRLDLVIWRDGAEHRLSFIDGAANGPMTAAPCDPARTGTMLTFKPSAAFFPITHFEFDALERHLTPLPWLCPGVTITLTDARETTPRTAILTLKGQQR